MLDAIVYHLDIVSRAALSHYPDARLLVLVFRCHPLEQWQDFFQRRLVSARAHGWPSSGSLVATADSAANVANAGVLDLLLSPLGVCEVFVAAVENDVVA